MRVLAVDKTDSEINSVDEELIEAGAPSLASSKFWVRKTALLTTAIAAVACIVVVASFQSRGVPEKVKDMHHLQLLDEQNPVTKRICDAKEPPYVVFANISRTVKTCDTAKFKKFVTDVTKAVGEKEPKSLHDQYSWDADQALITKMEMSTGSAADYGAWVKILPMDVFMQCEKILVARISGTKDKLKEMGDFIKSFGMTPFTTVPAGFTDCTHGDLPSTSDPPMFTLAMESPTGKCSPEETEKVWKGVAEAAKKAPGFIHRQIAWNEEKTQAMATEAFLTAEDYVTFSKNVDLKAVMKCIKFDATLLTGTDKQLETMKEAGLVKAFGFQLSSTSGLDKSV